MLSASLAVSVKSSSSSSLSSDSVLSELSVVELSLFFILLIRSHSQARQARQALSSKHRCLCYAQRCGHAGTGLRKSKNAGVGRPGCAPPPRVAASTLTERQIYIRGEDPGGLPQCHRAWVVQEDAEGLSGALMPPGRGPARCRRSIHRAADPPHPLCERDAPLPQSQKAPRGQRHPVPSRAAVRVRPR